MQERIEDAAEQTAEFAERIVELRSVLEQTLTVDDRIDFDSLSVPESFAPFDPPKELRSGTPAPSETDFLAKISAPTGLGKLVPGATKRYEQALQAAKTAFDAARRAHQRAETLRQQKLQEASAAYEAKKNAFLENTRRRNAEVDDFETRYREADADAIVAYNSMVLERSEFPEGFPEDFSVAFVPESKELVVDHELPLDHRAGYPGGQVQQVQGRLRRKAAKASRGARTVRGRRVIDRAACGSRNLRG